MKILNLYPKLNYISIFRSNPYLSIIRSYIIDSPAPSNISYLWNYGSLLGLCLIIQIISGIFLAMNYVGHIDYAFISIEHIMRDCNNGFIIRYLHANGATLFFFCLYIHISKALYYGSYRKPRILLWNIGVIIFIVSMMTAFIGYVLPFGQMSYWALVVITNLLSVIPWIGSDLITFIWGGFSPNTTTISRFFALHYLLPFILTALIIMHLIALHMHGSNNPLGFNSNIDKIPFHSYYTYKDLVGFFILFIILSIFVFFMPYFFIEDINFIPANPLVTPTSIVPEIYFLPFYAILRSIPNKTLGVIAMFGSLIILFLLPYLDLSKIRGLTFRPIMKIFFWLFIFNFLFLTWIGSKHIEEPFILLGRISTIYYFVYFIFILPFVSIIENTICTLGLKPYN